MTDIYQSSDDQIRDLGIIANYDVIGDLIDTSEYGPLPPADVGYFGTFDIDISDYAVQNSVVDVDIWMERVESAGVDRQKYSYFKLPFTIYGPDGNVLESAWHSIYYISLIPKEDARYFGPATLSIKYRNNSTSSAYPRFFYKISNRQVLNPKGLI